MLFIVNLIITQTIYIAIGRLIRFSNTDLLNIALSGKGESYRQIDFISVTFPTDPDL